MEIQWIEKGRTSQTKEPLMRKRGDSLSLTRTACALIGNPDYVSVGVSRNGFGHYIVIAPSDGTRSSDRSFRSGHVNGSTIRGLPMADGAYPIEVKDGMAVAYAEA